MRTLGIDIGSSSVKSAVLRNGHIATPVIHASFPTRFDTVKVEVNARDVLRAVAKAIGQARGAGAVDVIALSVMGPAWVAMDARGRALTPIVTHQDRRSVSVAKELLAAIGKARFLKINGSLPFPGGISSTTWAWFNRNHPGLMRRADLVGHLQTFLHRH